MDRSLRNHRSGQGSFLLLLAVLALASVTAPVALAQDDRYVPGEQAAPEAEGGEVDFGAVDDLLARDEEVLNDPGIYNYDPGSRRDPFKSLIKKSQLKDVPPAEQRPEGIPGLLVDEIEIQGIFVLDSGPVAQVTVTSSATSYLLRPGDQLWDGDVLRINLDEVVFKQTVNDPTALKPFREVVKKLNTLP